LVAAEAILTLAMVGYLIVKVAISTKPPPQKLNHNSMQDVALKILVVEDNDALREAMLAFLQQQGHYVRGVPMAEDIDDVTGGFIPDVYVIDLNLPDEDGLSLTRRLRAAQPNVCIVITTARAQIGDKVLGYESGADLYLTKPVDSRELMAGVSALGKRLRTLGQNHPAFVLDLERMQLSGPSGKVELTASDVLVLSALVRAPGKKLERWQMAEILGGNGTEPKPASTLEMRITRLRRKLAEVGAPSPQIKALHKVGYALCTPVVMQ
jgi:DNA-binding response OmpR family regulator